MYLKFFALIFLPFLPLLLEINGVPIFENSISSQPALFRRSPLELRVKSEGVGSGDGVGTSSTNFEMTDDPNDNSMNRLNVESNASGYGNGSNGRGYSSTSLNYSNNQDDGQNKMSLNTQAVGSGNGDFENSDGSGGVGISSTSLDLTTDDNDQDNRVRIQSEGVGVGSGNKGTGTSQTSLNFTSQPDSDNSDEGSNDINLQSNAFGVGSGPSGVGGGTTSLHTKNNETGETLDVRSTGIGAGENGGIGASSLSLNSNGPRNTQVDSKAVGLGKGDDAVGITNTTLQATDDDSTLETESTSVGIGDDNGTGLATSSLQAKEDNGRKTVDVNSTAVGTGDTEGVGLTNTTLEQKDSNGKTTKVDTTSVGQGNGDDSLGASQTSLHLDEDGKNVNQQLDDSSLTEEENVNALNESGGMGLSTNGLYIEDDEEGDINIDTTALGSGNGTGASGIGLQMEDASSKGLKVQTTSEGIGDSSKGVGGSSTVVLVDDEANERSVDARSIGIGFNNDEGSGGYTADSLKYHDTDREHEEVVDTSNGAVSKTVIDETSKVDIQNASTDYNMVSNDGTTTRSTQSSSTKTSKMSRVEKQSFYTTQGSIIQGEEDEIQNGDNVVFIPQVVDEDDVSLVDQDQEHVLVNQGSEQTTTLEENQLIFNEENAVEVISQDHNYVVSDEETLHTTNEDQRTFISNQESTRQIINKDYDYTASNYEIQSDQQSTRNVLNQDYDYSATNYEIQSNQRSTGDVVNENYEYSTTNYGIQQTESVDQDIFISDKQSSQQITNQEQAFILSNNQNSREVVNYNEENFVSSQQSSQQIMNQSSQQTVNVEQNTFMSNQQTEQDYVVSTQQKQNYNQTPSQQPSIGPRDIHPSTPANQPSSLLCPDNNRGPGVVCYYQVSSLFEYADGFILRPDAISTEYCDVLVVSYAVLDIDKLQIGAYSPDEECIFVELVKLKNRDLKVILQLQYVAFYEEYAKLLECDDNVNQFISAVVNSLRQWDFDGIELPLMIPQPNTNIHATAPIIKQNYPSLVQNLKSQLEQENLLLSICLPNDPDLIDSVYDIPELVEYVDWFSVNTIDYNGPDQGVLQYASPLTPQTLDDSFCIDYTVNSLIDQRGVPTDKVVINVPLYGSTFMLDNYKEKTYGAKVIGRGPPGPSSNTDGFLTISELCSLHQSNWLNTPAIVTEYDDVPTLVLKVTYARTKCLGGVAIHAITMDDPSGHLCESGSMPFTRAISLAYNPLRNAVSDEEDNDLLLVNYIDKSTTNKYEL